jgi:outer membrane protein assembly factor BamB
MFKFSKTGLPLICKAVLTLIAVTTFVISEYAFPGQSLSGEVQIERCWEYPYDGDSDGELAADGESVYMVRQGSTIDAVSLEDGKLRWSSDVGGTIASNLVTFETGLYFVRRTLVADKNKAEPVEIRAISVSTGVTKWNVEIADKGPFRLWPRSGELWAVAETGSYYAFSAADGALGQKVDASIGTPAVIDPKDNSVAFVAGQKEVRYIKDTEARSSLIAESPFQITAIWTGPGGSIVWGDQRGNLVSFDRAEGEIVWKFKSGAKITDIARVNGYLLAASNDDFVYAIGPGSGNRIWKKRLGGRIQAIDGVGERYVLVSTVGGHNLLLIDAADGKSAGQVLLDDDGGTVTLKVISSSSFLVQTPGSLAKYSLTGCNAGKSNGSR